MSYMEAMIIGALAGALGYFLGIISEVLLRRKVGRDICLECNSVIDGSGHRMPTGYAICEECHQKTRAENMKGKLCS